MKMLPTKKLYKKERANMEIHTGEPKHHSTTAPTSSCSWVRAQNPTQFTLSIDKMGGKNPFWEIKAAALGNNRDSHT